MNAILYVWAKRSPYINMNFMGMFDFQAVYLPWVILGLEYLLDNVRPFYVKIEGFFFKKNSNMLLTFVESAQGSLTFDILGIAVGHLFHFFTDVYPRTRGINLLPTPTFLYVPSCSCSKSVLSHFTLKSGEKKLTLAFFFFFIFQWTSYDFGSSYLTEKFCLVNKIDQKSLKIEQNKMQRATKRMECQL